MTPDRWELLTQLFGDVLERDPHERAEFLARACPDDPDLCAEVERLLAEHERSGSFINEPAYEGPPQRGPEASRFSPGMVLAGRFKILRFLGKGGMGEVYEAEDLELGESVAVKTILPELASNERTLERFKREIQLARKVTHPNVCRVFDLAHHRDQDAIGSGNPSSSVAFLTMELLRGETLADRLRRRGKMSAAEALPILEQIAAALDAAHSAGIIHRDLKSGNVILTPSAPPRGVRAVVTDFGLARRARDNGAPAQATVEVIAGTPEYMAPEQLEGSRGTAASDIYSLGLVLYEMMTGKPPFTGATPLEAGIKRLKEPPPSPRIHVPELGRNWEKAILRCLERDPGRRYTTALDVVKHVHVGRRVRKSGRR